MRKTLFAFISCLTAVALSGLPAQAAPAALPGTATLTVTSYDFCGPGAQRRMAGSTTYQLPAQVEIAAAGNGDTNPFSFFLSAGNAGALGSVELHSALVATATSGRVLLTYWRLSSDGRNISGVLVDPHLNEAAAANLFNEYRLLIPCRPELGQLPPWPGPLAAGTQMHGSVVNGHADISVTGSTTDGMADVALHFAG